ncbi:hypothetical protein VNI00_002842 [Paramarasmius palmivorus]|uniref:[RNA-polymerase]-subunit kinase n=1 Tax=Paramarasmius palmivorus TaxID=297713 RepID=A0AAW0DZ83_9AGAR
MDAVERENADRQKRWAKEQKVGEGTYAVVYRGREFTTGRKVAIKKIKVGQFKDGLDMSAIREVKYLRELKHQNVIELLDVFSSKTNLNLVLEFLDSDLEMIIKDRSLVFLPADIKSWMAMTFRGLEFCHRNFVLHRDLKPNNLLIAANGELKIADFGLARDFADPGYKMTCQVITRWYRPPELLFGSRYYSSAVDIWSVGCIFAELMLRTPYLAGESDMDQLKTIFRALGTPTEQEWPGYTKLPDYVPVGQFPKTPLRDLFTAASADAINLLSKCLIYEPRKRITCKEALNHPYFFAMPYPTHPSKLPKCSTQLAPRPLEEVDGNVDPTSTGPGVKAAPPKGRLKRKLTSPNDSDSKARSIARRLDFTKQCFAWSPDPLLDDLLALGYSSGRVDLIRLEASRYTGTDNVLSNGPNVSLQVKNQRACNTLAFCGKDPNYLAVGLDKVRGDASLFIWDVNSAMPLLAFGSGDTNTNLASISNAINQSTLQRIRTRPTPLLPRAEQALGRADSRILQAYAPGEHVSTLAFLPESTHLLLAGISSRWLRLFDLRTPIQTSNTSSGGFNIAHKVHGVATDPFDPHRIASWGDNVVSIWDTRRMSPGPLLTFTERDGAADGAYFPPSLLSTSASTSSLSGLPNRKGSGIMSGSTSERAAPSYTALEFSANRRGQLATLAKDAPFVRVWDILEVVMPSALASFSHSDHSLGDPNLAGADKATNRGRLLREREKSAGREGSVSSVSGGRKQTHSLSKRSWPNFSSWATGGGRTPSPDGDYEKYREPFELTSLVLCDTRKTHPLIPLSTSQHFPTSPRSLTSFALVPNISLYDHQPSPSFTKIVLITSSGELALQTLYDSPNAEATWSARGHIGGIGYRTRDEEASLIESRSATGTDGWASLSKSKSKSKSKSHVETEDAEGAFRGRPLGAAASRRSVEQMSNHIQPAVESRSTLAKDERYHNKTHQPVVERGRRQTKNVRTRSNIAVPSTSGDPISEQMSDDIASIMKRRAERGYGFENVLHNASLVRELSCSSSILENESLEDLWKWLYHVQSHISNPTGLIQGYDLTHHGVWAIWNGIGHDGNISYDTLYPRNARIEGNTEAGSAEATPVHRDTDLPLVLDGSILGEPLHRKKQSKSKRRQQTQTRTASLSARDKDKGSRTESPASGTESLWREVLKELVVRFSATDPQESLIRIRVSTAKMLQRQACLEFLGWGHEAIVAFDTKSTKRSAGPEGANTGELSQVACWLVFLGKWEQAVDILLGSEGIALLFPAIVLADLNIDPSHHMMSAMITALAPLMMNTESITTSAINTIPSHLRTHYSRLSSKLEDPYLQALLSYLTTGDLNFILGIESDEESKRRMVENRRKSISLRERLALAFVFLDDRALTRYLQNCVEKYLDNESDNTTAHLDALAVTGLASPVGRELLGRWTDRTADVQSAAILGWMGLANNPESLPGNRITTIKGKAARAQREDKRKVERWVETYRDLLDSWQMFHERVEFDIERGAIGQGSITSSIKPGTKIEWPAMPRQIIIRCNYCNKSITPLSPAHLQTNPMPGPVIPPKPSKTLWMKLSLSVRHVGTVDMLRILWGGSLVNQRKTATEAIMFALWQTATAIVQINFSGTS